MKQLKEVQRPKNAKPHSSGRFWSELVIITVLAIVTTLLVKTFLLQTFWIPSASMDPTLAIGDRVIVNKQFDLVGGIERSDIFVFNAPEDVAATGFAILVKRVIGMPGDTIEGRGDGILINGKPLDEPYLQPGVKTSDFGPIKLGENSYFMMGDNRDASKDSRSFGPIEADAMIGEVFLVFWPLNKFSWK